MNKPFNKYFDHTLLRPDATAEDIRHLAEETVKYDFAAMCVNGCHVKYSSRLVNDMDATDRIKIASVVGFPLGASSSAVKMFETDRAITDGASEIDMVMNLSAAKSKNWTIVEDEIKKIVEICSGKTLLKVILETCLLTDDEIVRACLAARDSGADFVKTSTGFSTEGATVSDVLLMKNTVGEDLKVKASGGIRTLSDAKAMLDAGADRLGCSASVDILAEFRRTESPDLLP